MTPVGAVQFVVLRVLYPRLWGDPQHLRQEIGEELVPRAPRLWLFQLLAGAIPLTGAVLLVASGAEISSGRLFRVLVTGLIVLGMAGFGVAVLLSSIGCERTRTSS